MRWSPRRARRSKLPDSRGSGAPAVGPRHSAVRRLRALLRDQRARALEGAFVAEGPRVVGAALDRGVPLEAVYFGPNANVAFAPLTARVEAAGIDVVVLNEGVFERMGSTVTPQPVLGVAPIPDVDERALRGDGLVLVGVALADPGNVGTILRSAEASGAAAIVLSRGSVDAYNPKVVRASAGAIFGVAVFEGPDRKGWSAVDALDALGDLGRQRLGADAAGGTPYPDVDFRRPTAVVLGNETRGLDADVESRLDGKVTIPMRAPVESLNVAMAATVVCFESARQRASAGA